jgi:hypothetical protein
MKGMKDLSYEIEITIKEVLSSENIALIDRSSYIRLWNACALDRRCLSGNYTTDDLRLIIVSELQQCVYNYCPIKKRHHYSY